MTLRHSATPTLASSQQALLSTLFAAGRGATTVDAEFIANYAYGDCTRGLNAYKSNAHSLAERSLASVYPVLVQLLGDESFAAFARAFWHAYPPQRGDLAHWGGALADFTDASSQLVDVPYLADVARVEWALHQAATAPDADADLATLHHLMEQDPAVLHLRLAPGLKVVASGWPVVSLVNAHIDSAGQTPNLTRASERLQNGTAETALIWRQGFKPQVREALTGEASFVIALQTGHPLGEALSVVCSTTDPDTFDFALWLPQAVSTGLLLAVDCLIPGSFGSTL